MKLNFLGLIAVIGVLGFGLPMIVRRTTAPSLPVLGQSPQFKLQDVEGRDFSSESLHGKVWVVHFFFSSCQATCPTIMGTLSTISREFEKDTSFNMVSISVDPTVDTPEILAKYGERFSADPARWHLLTGTKSDIENVAFKGFKAGTPEQPLLHTNRVMLIDQEGRIRGTYMAMDAEAVSDLRRDIRTLE